ncbi:hypothetical protein ACFX5U_15495 [Sphingobacterium sp. SG20118]|uniref:hypothetical protein n=1 Tax=Sphingobacterium sp. SG20118 TaxID=3367156 RepID=UPI0037DFC751
MKKNLNNEGVGLFQAELFQLSLSEQQFLIMQIRLDFALFMATHFDLHKNQIIQINSMSDSFKSMLAEGIATTWESGQPINFYKETLAEDDVPDAKDIIMSDPNSPLMMMSSGNPIPLPLMILIRYRP